MASFRSILITVYSTDEQAPIPDVFDQLIHRMSEANQGVDVIFNCQMGYVYEKHFQNFVLISNVVGDEQQLA